MESNFSPPARIRGVDRPDDPMHDCSAKEQALMKSRTRYVPVFFSEVQKKGHLKFLQKARGITACRAPDPAGGSHRQVFDP
jgi:hypothetical protein